MFFELALTTSYLTMLYGVYYLASLIPQQNINYVLPQLDHPIVSNFEKYIESINGNIYIDFNCSMESVVLLTLFLQFRERFDTITIVHDYYNKYKEEFVRNISYHNDIQYFIINRSDEFIVEDGILFKPHTLTSQCKQLFTNYFTGWEGTTQTLLSYCPLINVTDNEIKLICELNNIPYIDYVKDLKVFDELNRTYPNWERYILEISNDKSLMKEIIMEKIDHLFEDIQVFEYGCVIPMFEDFIPEFIIKYLLERVGDINITTDELKHLCNIINTNTNLTEGYIGLNTLYFFNNRKLIIIYNVKKLQEHFDNEIKILENEPNEYNNLYKFLDGHYVYRCSGGTREEHDYCSYENDTLMMKPEPSDELSFIQSHFKFLNFGRYSLVGC